MAKSSPTVCTLNLLRGENKQVAVVEKYLQFRKIKQDLFGFIDIIALDVEGKCIWGVQTTSISNISSRIKKICCGKCRQYSVPWLQTGNRLEVIAWDAKLSVIGRKRYEYKLKRVEITMDDMDAYGDNNTQIDNDNTEDETDE